MKFSLKQSRRALLGALVISTGLGFSVGAQAKYPDRLVVQVL